MGKLVLENQLSCKYYVGYTQSMGGWVMDIDITQALKDDDRVEVI